MKSFALVVLLMTCQLAAAAQRPNILFIFSDDHAMNAIGAYGGKAAKTPHLDRLAREGMLFRHCLVTNSICGPSRATVLTGKYNHLNGFPDNSSFFDNTQQTYPKLLQKAGYQTCVIGKWHLESDPTGFDHWMVVPGQGQYYNPDFLTAQGKEHIEGYISDVITDESLKWLKTTRDPSKPFMLCYWHKAPHREWSPGPHELGLYDRETIPEPSTLFDDYSGRASPAREQQMSIDKDMTINSDLKMPWLEGDGDEPKFGGRKAWYNRMTDSQRALWDAHYNPIAEAFRKAKPQGKELVRWKYQQYMKDYLSTVAGVDRNIGRVLDYLKETGLDKNTIVVYSADQGFYLGEHGWFDKRWMYEESLHTPLIVRWPGVVKPGTENKNLVSTLDFAETFLEAAGVEQPKDMQGRSLVQLLKGEPVSDWRTAHYYHYYEYPQPHHVAPHFGVRTETGYKLIHYYQSNEWELFDLNKDPSELKSVDSDADYGTIRESLMSQMKELQVQYQDTDPTAPPSKVRKIPGKQGKGKGKGAAQGRLPE
ncbi:MAG: sulfatase [Verrucomicrobiaceae bacterium]|nr:sulfatase [Verrucomicrobiaceae bacterium]